MISLLIIQKIAPHEWAVFARLPLMASKAMKNALAKAPLIEWETFANKIWITPIGHDGDITDDPHVVRASEIIRLENYAIFQSYSWHKAAIAYLKQLPSDAMVVVAMKEETP